MGRHRGWYQRKGPRSASAWPKLTSLALHLGSCPCWSLTPDPVCLLVLLQGFLQLSVVVLGPGDKQRSHGLLETAVDTDGLHGEGGPGDKGPSGEYFPSLPIAMHFR